jgi:DNA polymerase-3 subunit alpha
VPLYKDQKTGAIATQFDMNHLEKSGLVKMDFLGLKTLAVIKHTDELIRDRGGEYANFDVEKVNEDDKATFKMLSEGMSFEVFQFESDGMQNVLKRARPNSIEDLIALNSLYRPGPMANIDQFVDSKNGRQRITYPDPSLEEILKETYGVIVYQEQVMQVARIIAGYSLSQADLLRKAMGKKIKEILDKEKIPFLEGAARQGYSREKAEEIFDMLIPFAGYGFNKSHAAGYAVLAYRTAYLKANFPAEFMAANLTNEINSADKDKLSVCISEARKMGIAVDPPDINRSNKLFTISEGRIVYGFLGIKGLGDIPSDEIVNCRKEGPYRDFMDFLNRVDIKAIGKSVIEKLVQTGAFDNLGTSRETLLGNLERAVDYIQNIKDEKKFGQGSLFGDTGEKEYIDFEFEEFPEISREDKLKIEKELIGFYFSGHPMDEYKDLWQSLVKVNLGKPETFVSGSQVLVGLLKNIKIINTSSGEKMAFASLEDYNGEIEIKFIPGIWEKYRDSLDTDKVAILKGKIDYQQSRDKRSFMVDECLDVDEAEKLSKTDEARSRKWDKYRNIWKYAAELDLRIPDLGDPTRAESGTYTVLGVLKSLRTHMDKNGKEMAFGTIEDFRGEIDLVFFSRAWENCKALTAVDEVIALKGTIEPARDRNSGKVVLIVSSVQDLNKLLRAAAKKAAEASEASETFAKVSAAKVSTAEISMADKETKESESAPYREIHIRLAASAANNEAALNSLKRRLYENPGNCPVYLHIPAASEEGTASKGISSETVIRTANHINAVVLLSDLSPDKYAAVADVWGK